MIRVGPAGWSYADWSGPVYPRREPGGFQRLAHIARFVQAVEINSSFYGLPRASNATKWCETIAGSPSFRFTAKLLRSFTHEAMPRDEVVWNDLAAGFKAGIAPLHRAGRLAALLVQFPVTFQFGTVEVDRLHRIHALFSDLPLALEVRHSSWFEPQGLNVVGGLGYSLVHIDLPHSWDHPPEWHRATGPVGYLRLHGRNSKDWFRRGAGRDARYDYLYTEAEIEEQARRAERIAQDCDETYVITNNHFQGKAMVAALQFMHALSGEAPAAPAELMAAYPQLDSVTRSQGQRTFFTDT